MLFQNYKTIRFAILISPLILTACANRTEVQFVSYPSGATITEFKTGTAFGKSPINRQFDLDSMGDVNEEGCYILDGIEAQWLSGASKRLPELQLCGRHKRGYTVTLIRPPAYPDLEKDIEFANALQAGVDRAEKRFVNYLRDTRM